MRKLKIFGYVFLGILVLLGMFVVVKAAEHSSPLDPDRPILLTLWHYRVGTAKTALDEIIKDFNDTIGREEGIVVEAYNIADVTDLYHAVYASASGQLGANPLPDIFATYNKYAYHIDQVVGLANLEDYFTESELEEYNSQFIESGRFGDGNRLKNLAIAKSTECVYLNRTDWDIFADATGASLESLQSWEGLVDTAEKYYNWCGKAFWGNQNIINFMKTTAALERNKNGISNEETDIRRYYSKEAAFKIWKCYYEPLVKGHYSEEIETTRSMNVIKQGGLLMGIASTGGASYFPEEVVADGKSGKAIECEVMEFPVFQGEKKIAVMRGNDMAVIQSDYAHEYAAVLFLKWLTEPEQNIKYAVPTGYLPVKKAALEQKEMWQEVEGNGNNLEVVKKAQQTALRMLEEYEWYGDQVSEGNEDYDFLFETAIREKAAADRSEVESRLADGEQRDAVLSEYIKEESFIKWYEGFVDSFD